MAVTMRNKQARAAAASRLLRRESRWAVRYIDEVDSLAPLQMSATGGHELIVMVSDTANRGAQWASETRQEIAAILEGHGYQVRVAVGTGVTQTLAICRTGWRA